MIQIILGLIILLLAAETGLAILLAVRINISNRGRSTTDSTARHIAAIFCGIGIQSLGLITFAFLHPRISLVPAYYIPFLLFVLFCVLCLVMPLLSMMFAMLGIHPPYPHPRVHK